MMFFRYEHINRSYERRETTNPEFDKVKSYIMNVWSRVIHHLDSESSIEIFEIVELPRIVCVKLYSHYSDAGEFLEFLDRKYETKKMLNGMFEFEFYTMCAQITTNTWLSESLIVEGFLSP